MKFLIPIILVSIAVAISTWADVLFKKSQFANVGYVFWGIILYAIGAIPVALAFKFIDFSLVFFIWEGIAIILGLSLGLIIFKEGFSILKFAAFASAFMTLIFSYFASK